MGGNASFLKPVCDDESAFISWFYVFSLVEMES